MAKKYEFDLSELSDVDQKKVKDLIKKSKEEKKAREQKKELQKDVNKIFADYCRKNFINLGLHFFLFFPFSIHFLFLSDKVEYRLFFFGGQLRKVNRVLHTFSSLCSSTEKIWTEV